MCVHNRPCLRLSDVLSPHQDGRKSQTTVDRPIVSLRRERLRAANRKLVGEPTEDSLPYGKLANLNKIRSRMHVNNKAETSDAKRRLKCEKHGTVYNRDKENEAFPAISLSRSQTFENKFRIAASRTNGNESPVHSLSPQLKSHRSSDVKKIIHLPLFRINLKSYAGEIELARTVASTRESLRKLMELHKAKMINSNIVTANIKNYEFSAPASACHLTQRSADGNQTVLTSQPFHGKPALKHSKRDAHFKSATGSQQKQHQRHGSSNMSESVQSGDTQCTLRSAYTDIKSGSKSNREQLASHSTLEPEESISSLALRPDTSLTLGSTMHHIDRVFRSPGSDELRELNEHLRNTDPQPAWPVVNEIQRMGGSPRRHYRRSKTSMSRPGTVLDSAIEEDECDYCVQDQLKNSSGLPTCPITRNNGHDIRRKPVLRYTSKEASFKLDPVIVPSHTHTECPMCNLYTRECETDAPPNTPNTYHAGSIYLEPPETPRLPAVRGTRFGARADVLHLSRINVNGLTGASMDIDDDEILT